MTGAEEGRIGTGPEHWLRRSPFLKLVCEAVNELNRALGTRGDNPRLPLQLRSSFAPASLSLRSSFALASLELSFSA